jgi:hypothetical protein
MPLNAETEAILKDLEGDGFDLTSIRQQANRNPILENKANSRLGGGLLRREEYTRYKATADEQVANLQKQVRELASAHDSLGNFKGNDALYDAALNTITVMEENLISAGFSPEDVKALTHTDKQNLQDAVNKAKTKDEATKVEERKEVPDKSDYIDSNTLQTTLANLAGGVMLSTVKIQRQLAKADRLGVEITSDLEKKFEQNLLSGLEAGKSYEDIASETFGFAAIEKANSDKIDNERIETRARELTAEKLKEIGVPESAARTRPKSIMDAYNGRLGTDPNAENAIKGEGGTTLVRGRQLPANKFGDAEFYKLRGDRATRIAHAVASMNELQDKRPELFEDPY